MYPVLWRCHAQLTLDEGTRLFDDERLPMPVDKGVHRFGDRPRHLDLHEATELAKLVNVAACASHA